MKTILFFFCAVLMSTALLSQTSYTWVGPSSASWTVSTNWSPARTTPASDDILLFNSGGFMTVSNVPTEQISNLTISGNTSLNLQSSGGIQLLTIGNGTGDDLIIISGSILYLNGVGAGSSLTLKLADNSSALISGVLNIGAVCTYDTDGTSVITQVNSTVINYGTLISTTSSKLFFNNSSTYNHWRDGGVVPTASWSINSVCTIIGTITNVPSGLGQVFGNFVWQGINQGSNNLVIIEPAIGIAGYLRISGTGTTGSIKFAKNPLTIGGDLNAWGGTLLLAGNADATINVAGQLYISNGTINMSSGSGTGTLNLTGNFRLNSGMLTETGSGRGKVNFNGTSIQTYYSSGGSISNSIDLTVNNAATLNMQNASTVVTGETFTLSPGGTLGITSVDGISSSGAIGNIQATGTRNFSSGGNYVYNGISGAQISGNGLPPTVANLFINNASGITLSVPTAINTQLTFASGKLTSSSSNLLTINDDAIVLGANNNRFVNGPVRKIGDDAFTFPVGKNGVGYMPITISAPANLSDAFQAEYKRASASALGPVTDPQVSHVSNCEYWNLDRTGTSNVDVTLYWNTNSPCAGAYVTTLTGLRLCHFDGTSWNSSGNDNASGTPASGSITWNNVSIFSPFALGSSTNLNPLPVTFTNVKAYETNNGINLEWSNLTETDMAYYTIERSADGRRFVSVGQVTARGNHGNREDYEWLDASPNAQQNYYRIKATEISGKEIWSQVVNINLSSENGGIVIYPNPVTDRKLFLQCNKIAPGKYTIQIVNSGGKKVCEQLLYHPGGSLTENIKLPQAIQPGMYYIMISSQDFRQAKNFVLK